MRRLRPIAEPRGPFAARFWCLGILALCYSGLGPGLAAAESAVAVHGSPQVTLQFRIVIPQMMSLSLKDSDKMNVVGVLGRGQDLVLTRACPGFPGPGEVTVLRSKAGWLAESVEVTDHDWPGCQVLYHTVAAP